MSRYGPATLRIQARELRLLAENEIADEVDAHASAWAKRETRIEALERKLAATAFEATGYLDVVNARKAPDAAIVVSVGFVRRVAALAAGESE